MYAKFSVLVPLKHCLLYLENKKIKVLYKTQTMLNTIYNLKTRCSMKLADNLLQRIL